MPNMERHCSQRQQWEIPLDCWYCALLILLGRAEFCVGTTDQHNWFAQRNLMIFSWQFLSFSTVQLDVHWDSYFLYKFLVQEYYLADWRTSVIPT